MNVLKKEVIHPCKMKKFKEKIAPPIRQIYKKHSNITKNIVYSICLDLFPITCYEIKNLRNLLKAIEPTYKMPTEKQLYEVILPHFYYQLKDKVSNTIKDDLVKG